MGYMRTLLVIGLLSIALSDVITVNIWEINKPAIRPFDDSQLTYRHVIDKILVGRFNEIRINKAGEERLHTGVDYARIRHSEILASGGGVVVFAEWAPGYGNTIIIDHGRNPDGNRTTSLYAHIQKFKILEGTEVNRGDVIGYVGSTGTTDGNHIHFEVIVKTKKRVFPGRYFN